MVSCIEMPGQDPLATLFKAPGTSLIRGRNTWAGLCTKPLCWVQQEIVVWVQIRLYPPLSSVGRSSILRKLTSKQQRTQTSTGWKPSMQTLSSAVSPDFLLSYCGHQRTPCTCKTEARLLRGAPKIDSKNLWIIWRVGIENRSCLRMLINVKSNACWGAFPQINLERKGLTMWPRIFEAVISCELIINYLCGDWTKFEWWIRFQIL